MWSIPQKFKARFNGLVEGTSYRKAPNISAENQCVPLDFQPIHWYWGKLSETLRSWGYRFQFHSWAVESWLFIFYGIETILGNDEQVVYDALVEPCWNHLLVKGCHTFSIRSFSTGAVWHCFTNHINPGWIKTQTAVELRGCHLSIILSLLGGYPPN